MLTGIHKQGKAGGPQTCGELMVLDDGTRHKQKARKLQAPGAQSERWHI